MNYKFSKYNFLLSSLLFLLCSCSTYNLNWETEITVRKIKKTGSSLIVRFTEKTPRVLNDRNYYWIRQRKIHNTVGGYSGHLLHGTYEEYYISGSLKKKGEFKKGLKTSTWMNWDESGELLSKVEYKHGFAHGEGLIRDNNKIYFIRFKKDQIIDTIKIKEPGELMLWELQ